jgi:HEPN domain-containing protein
MRRHRDWLRQAKRKLESAQWAIQGQFYEDACFAAPTGSRTRCQSSLGEPRTS